MKKTLAVLAALVLLFTACSEEGYTVSPRAEDIASIDYVVHAAGELYGYDTNGAYRQFLGSNSKEGLENCAENGVRAVELDFNFTSDGKLVCIHDWTADYLGINVIGEAPAYDTFISSEIYWNFTPIDTSDVCDYLKNNPDSYIITDIKEHFEEAVRILMTDCGEFSDRIIVQIYDTDQYDAVRAIGFDNIILTLYMLPWEEKTDAGYLTRFAEDHPLVGFTFAAVLCDENGFLDAMKKSGVPLFVHTVNGEDEQKKYFDMGIDGIYTDDV